MNNNKKILKRLFATFLAALNIFNFAGGSSKALNLLNMVEYVETDSKKRKEGKCKLVSELEDFLNLLENVDFEQDVSELIAKKNLKRLISVRIRIGKENLERIISMLCTDKENKENLERLISARIRNGICLYLGCYYIVNKDGYNVLFLNFNDDLIVNEKDFKKSNVLSLLSNLLKFSPSKFDLSESELDILSELELSFFPELGIRFLWKLYKELSKSKFDIRFVIYKIKENTLAEQVDLKRTLNDLADINFIDADQINELKARCKMFREKAEQKDHKKVLNGDCGDTNFIDAFYAGFFNPVNDEFIKLKPRCENEEELNQEKEEAKSDLNEANQELKEKEDIGEHIETLNKIDELKNDKTKCENEAKTNLGELDKTPEASDTLGQHPGNIEQGVDNLQTEKNTAEENLETANEINKTLETSKNESAEKLKTANKEKEDVLNLAYKEEIGEHIETLNKIDELENDKTKCENEAKTNLGELDKTPEASDTLGQHPGNIEQGVDDLQTEKNTAEENLETANSRAKKLGVVAVFGILVSLGCVFQNELKNACGTVYKKVLELKNKMLG